MRPPRTFRTPIPIFVPALSVALVLSVLFLVGLKEQDALIEDRVEQVIRQHEIIAQIVADNMDQSLRLTEESVSRFAWTLSQELTRELAPATIEQRFDATTEALPDGTVRSRRASYRADSEAGIWIPDYTPVDLRTQQLFVSLKRATDLFGRGSQSQTFANAWVLPMTGGIVIYWPDEPDFVFDAAPDMDYRNTDWVQLANPARSPDRKARWTNINFDPVPQIWMMSAVAPVFWNDQWIGSAGHDLPLDNLLQRTQLLRQSTDSYFALVTGDGRVVASARYAESIKQSAGTLTLEDLLDDNLVKAVEQARPTLAQQPFQRIRVNQHEIFVAHIPQQDWLLLNAIPRAPIASHVQDSFTNLRNIALLALVAELIIATLILAWSHHRSRRQYNHLAEMQQQLARSEYHYRTLVDNIPGIVYRCRNDKDWTMLFVSSTIEKFSGYPADDFINSKTRSFASIMHEEDRPQAEALVARSLEQDRPFVLEYRIVSKSGKVRWMLEHGRRAASTNSECEELEGVILDISALKQAEAKLRDLNDSLEHQVEDRTVELRSAIRDLETFNYAVSHDLKAPVRQVAGFLEAIADELPGNASTEIRDMIRRCQNALQRMKEMIASLHAYSELNREALTIMQVNVNDLLSYIIEQLPEPTRQRVSITVPPIDNVQADRTMLRIVLHHLIENAIKFSSQAEKPAITFMDHSTSAEWMLEISDNGVGFNPDYTDNMFQLFQRLHSQDAFPGYGVGLALARKIMALHGGRIWAESEPGKGASLFIAIPVKATAGGTRKFRVEL